MNLLICLRPLLSVFVNSLPITFSFGFLVLCPQCKSSLYIRDLSILPTIYVESISSHSVTYLLILLVVFLSFILMLFDVAKFIHFFLLWAVYFHLLLESNFLYQC